MVGLYVAATVVTLVQYFRLRERRLLPLLALFAFQALSHTLQSWDPLKTLTELAVCAAGLVLLLMLSPRHPPGAKA